MSAVSAYSPRLKELSHYYLLGSECLRLKKFDSAFQAFSNVIFLANENEVEELFSTRIGLADIYIERGDFIKASMYKLILLSYLNHPKICYKDSKKARIYYLEGTIHCYQGFHKKALIAYEVFLHYFLPIQKDPDLEELGDSIFCHLSYCCFEVGDFKKMDHYLKQAALKWNEKKEGPDAFKFAQLSICYKGLGQYENAKTICKTIIDSPSEEYNKGPAWCNLGLVHDDLGSYLESLSAHEKDFEIANKYNIHEGKRRASFNIAVTHLSFDKDDIATEALENYLKEFSKHEDVEQHALALHALGVIYLRQGEEAHSENRLLQALENTNQFELNRIKWRVSNTLGKLYLVSENLKDLEKAEEHLLIALESLKNLDDFDGKGVVYSSLAHVYQALGDKVKEKEHFELSIQSFSQVWNHISDHASPWKISIFERQFVPYRKLEKYYLEQNDHINALLVSDSSRAKALIGILREKLNVPESERISIDQILKIAKDLKTTIIEYSCDPFDEVKGWCWVIAPENPTPIAMIPLNLEQTLESLGDYQVEIDENFGSDEMIGQFRGSRLQKKIAECLKGYEIKRGDDKNPPNIEKLSHVWYNDLIKPIKGLLKAESSVTIVADAYLSNLPFSLFTSEEGKHLFETVTLSIAPSIEALIRMDEWQKRKDKQTKKDISVITNEYGVDEELLPSLPHVANEGKAVGRQFLQERANSLHCPNIEEVKEKVQNSRCIHFSCHGLAGKKKFPNSIFAGGLYVNQNGCLYVEDLKGLNLNADVVFLSACSSGRGQVYKEGVIGLPHAFLSEGAASVISTKWGIYDKATKDIVKKFYEEYLYSVENDDICNQAEALRKAIIFGKKNYPKRPDAWGSFFLTGLPYSPPFYKNREPLKTFQIENGEVTFFMRGTKVEAQVKDLQGLTRIPERDIKLQVGNHKCNMSDLFENKRKGFLEFLQKGLKPESITTKNNKISIKLKKEEAKWQQ
ncbi:MAG: CHAT domain-containing protein [Chlamydiia bacterium]|nr:CHAT domain-containing protein [Chlamydiia bacterium]